MPQGQKERTFSHSFIGSSFFFLNLNQLGALTFLLKQLCCHPHPKGSQSMARLSEEGGCVQVTREPHTSGRGVVQHHGPLYQ